MEIPVVSADQPHPAEPAPGTAYTWQGLPAGTWASFEDHPLSANCRRCGRGLILPVPLPEGEWRHRGENELVDSPIGGY